MQSNISTKNIYAITNKIGQKMCMQIDVDFI